MTRLVRWNPARELMDIRNEFDRLFDEAFGVTRTRWSDGTAWTLPLDVVERDEDFVVTASLPGVNPDDIDISMADNTLTIKAEVKEDKEVEEAQYHLRERRYGSFMRSVTLPVQVDADHVEAAYENGVLTLTIAKAEEIKPRRIQIKANGQKKVIEGKKS
ncbi:MAG: Hsp20/alpha crystallin family protein [Candidatus Thermofonsia bacterium]|nr:MAG: Hsp20/alpha crystallin family protein [Candidatus Thermofonsia bacterium]